MTQMGFFKNQIVRLFSWEITNGNNTLFRFVRQKQAQDNHRHVYVIQRRGTEIKHHTTLHLCIYRFIYVIMSVSTTVRTKSWHSTPLHNGFVAVVKRRSILAIYTTITVTCSVFTNCPWFESLWTVSLPCRCCQKWCKRCTSNPLPTKTTNKQKEKQLAALSHIKHYG